MECNFSFKHHLHNGDPLTGYTVHVPANRPKVGHAPPFTFEESAVDAIKLMKYDQVTNWSLSFILLKLEGYNGFGYNRKGIHTPYLWSYSNHYTKGKYVKDGVYDANAVSSQLGAAVILKRMEDQRGKFGVIVAGYTENIHMFIESNPGFKSRFDKTFVFEDYNPEQLWQITRSLLQKENLTPTPDAENHLKDYLTGLYENRDAFFGNARTARQVVGELPLAPSR
jgi:hypothetical protein